MCSFSFYAAADDGYDIGHPVECGEGSYTHQTVSIPFLIGDVSITRLLQDYTSFAQDYHASQSEQSIVSAYPEANLYGQATPFYYSSGQESYDYQEIPTPEVLEASGSNNVIHSPSSDLHLTTWVRSRPHCPRVWLIYW